MIIDIVVILKLFLISLFNGWGVLILYPYQNTNSLRRTPCVIIRITYIPLDKLYIIDEPIR